VLFLKYWDVLLAVLIIAISLYIFICSFKKHKDQFQHNIWKYYLLPSSFSIIVVLLILIGLSFKSESKIFQKLSEGEVIVGLAIVAPTLFSWLKVDKQKKEEIEISLLRDEYFKWLDNNLKEYNLITRVKLDTLLCRNDKVKESVIDYTDLFIAIQSGISEDYEGVDTKEWRRINTSILKKIKNEDAENLEKLKNKIVTSKSMKKLKYIDFKDEVAKELLTIDVWPDTFEYSNCIFSSVNILEFSSQTEYIASKCIFDDFDEFKKLCKENDIKFKIKNYYLKEAIDECIEINDNIENINTGESMNEYNINTKKINKIDKQFKKKRGESVKELMSVDKVKASAEKLVGKKEKVEESIAKSARKKEKVEEPTAKFAEKKEKVEGPTAKFAGKKEKVEGPTAEFAGKKEKVEEPTAKFAGRKEKVEGPTAEFAGKKEKGSKVCDKRNFGLTNEITKYLFSEKIYDIDINSSNESNKIESINNKIIAKVREKLGFEKEGNIVISRSLSHVPSSIKDTESYLWYSYNTLNKDDLNENTNYIIFAVQLNRNNNKEFKCLIFDIENFKDLYGESFENIRGSETGKWHFIFVERKYLVIQVNISENKYIRTS